MKSLKLKITTQSGTLTGSGEGWGAAVDSDIVFDKYGLPYIPAKRIKGCLKESAMEVKEMFQLSEMGKNINLQSVFQEKGSNESACVEFENLYVEEYGKNRDWLEWGIGKFNTLISRETVVSILTSTRQQTAIDEKGIGKEHSLRTMRVIKKDLVFTGNIHIQDKITDNDIEMLCLAVKNLRYIGTNRNRGFGHVNCELLKMPEESEIKVAILEDKDV